MKDVVSRCPIEETMRVLSGRWPTLLLYYLKEGSQRFSELRRKNPTVSHRILTLELRKLEVAGIVRRTAHPGYPLRVDYDLTDSGHRLVPLIDALGTWWDATEAARQVPSSARSPLRARRSSAAQAEVLSSADRTVSRSSDSRAVSRSSASRTSASSSASRTARPARRAAAPGALRR